MLLAILSIAVSFYGCKGASKETFQNGDFKIELLFEKDGCRVYRFKDRGRYIYWANCQGRMQSDVHHSTGKSSYTKHMESFTNDAHN